MKNKTGRLSLKISALLFAGILSLCYFSTQFAYAENADYATVENTLNVDTIYVGETLEPEQEPVIEFDGMITDNNTESEFVYTAPRDGQYYFGVTNVKENCSVSLSLYDSLGNKISSSSGIMVTFEEKETYTIVVQQKSGNTNFTVQIIPPRESIDITDATVIKDRITFKKQSNTYLYTAPMDGTYQFYLSDATANIKFKLYAWDQYGTQIIDATTGEKTSVNLEKDETYKIQVSYSDGLGKYTLNVCTQKPQLDISGYTNINDSLEYRDQSNNYYFEAPVEGDYVFTIEGLNSSVNCKWGMYLDSADVFATQWGYISNSESHKVTLEQGEVYHLLVNQYDGKSNYTITIEYPFYAQQYLEDFSRSLLNENYDEEYLEDDTIEIEDESESTDENTSTEDLILQQLEELQSKMDELEEENEMLKNALEENEIEFD